MDPSSHNRRLPFFLAIRYLFSRKEKTVINLISWISLAGIAVSTMALIVVMSVYNGIGLVTQSLFNVFDPELIVEPATGKTFHTSSLPYDNILSIPGVANVSPLVEENAWLTLRQAEAIVQLRGVDDNYGRFSGLDTLVYDGEYLLKTFDPMSNSTRHYLLLGWNVMLRLGVNSMTNIPVAVHIPKRGTSSIGFTLDEAFNNDYAFAAGAFRIQEEIDNLYAVADIDFVRSLMRYSDDEVTSLALSLSNPRQANHIKRQLQQLIGDNFTIKDRYEQKPLYYKIFRSERWGVFLILSLIVFISTLNLIASLSLLIINKRRDIGTLRALGMQGPQLRQVFFSEGIMIALLGVGAGLILGFVTCMLQQHFGIIKLGTNAVVEAFPVAMRLIDFVATFLVVSLLSTLVVAFTIKHAKI